MKENLANGSSIKYATFVLAAWCFYCDKGINEKGELIKIIDEQKAALHQAAKDTGNNWTAFLQQAEIFGNLADNERFTIVYTSMVQSIYKENNIKNLITDLL